jgi:hypothetical protein
MTTNGTTGTSSRDQIRQRVWSMVAGADTERLAAPELDACVEQAIDWHWPSAVATYVPLLAFRDVQDCVRHGSCPGISEPLPQ